MSESELLVLDLEHLGSPGVMCTYVVVGDEVAIVDPGPSTTLPTLERALGGHGISLTDVRHILLTHVHLDHAGATGHLASRLPGVLVHLHRDGAPHIVDPVRLVASTRRTFGDAHDRLWGEVLPVTAGQIRAWEPGERGPMPGLRAFHSPGHIAHHLAYLDERTGTLLAGDALGIVLAPGAATHAPTPAPSLDIEAWLRTLVDLAWLEPERMGVTHFGLHENVTGRRRELYDGSRLSRAGCSRPWTGTRTRRRPLLHSTERCAPDSPRAHRRSVWRRISVVSPPPWTGPGLPATSARETDGCRPSEAVLVRLNRALRASPVPPVSTPRVGSKSVAPPSHRR